MSTSTQPPRDRGDQVLARRVRTLRAAHGWTLEELAHLAGLKVAHLSAIETGRINNPGYQSLIALSRVFGLSLDEFLGLRDARLSEKAFGVAAAWMQLKAEDKQIIEEMVATLLKRVRSRRRKSARAA